ncbi:efflux RND transporter periplasmic adaptor subunit [candidate division WOR-3 bacterium]|nr:efflux RND transporter periplasmic adaptor subunit [candidate division WOR-3 bacterium]
MNDKAFKIILSTVCLALLFAGSFGCSKKPKNNKNPFSTSVRTIEVNRGLFINRIRSSGKIEGQREVDLSFKSGGRVLSVSVEVGDLVRKNEVIATLEQTDFYANYVQAQAAFTQAQDNFTRSEELYNSGLVSQVQFQAAQTAFQSAQAGLMLAQSAVSGASIKAPFDGTITASEIDPQEMASPGMPYFGIADMDSVKLKLSVSSENVTRITEGASVTVQVDAYRDRIFYGQIDRVYPAADRQTGKFTVEVVCPNSENLLLPGMIGLAMIEIGRYEDAIIVPLKSVLMQEGETVVFRASGGKAVRTLITVEQVNDSFGIVLNGLNVSDTVIVAGQDYIEDGSLINCVMCPEYQAGDEK